MSANLPRLVLFEPDIPQNLGALLRLGACLGLPVEVIEPCGFLLDDRRLSRTAMDYRRQASLTLHRSAEAFFAAQGGGGGGRLVAVDTAGAVPLPRFVFAPGDRLLFGRESCGLPAAVLARTTASVAIPMRAGARSLNLATAAAIIAAAALEQLRLWPGGNAAGGGSAT